MRNISQNGVVYYSFEIFDRLGLVNGYTTRIGGVSAGRYNSLNLGLSGGDERGAVIQNLELAAKAIGFEPERTVLTHQTHSANIRRLSLDDAGKGFYTERDYSDIDGLITNEPNLVLSCYSADCCTIFAYDSANRAIGLAHSGWKGTLKRMAEAMLSSMNTEFGTMPENLVCGIAPCILPCCFEVDADVADSFGAEFSYINEYISAKNNKFHIDLQGINKRMLCDNNVLPENIELIELCTHCGEEEFYSHRRDGLKRGSLAAFFSI